MIVRIRQEVVQIWIFVLPARQNISTDWETSADSLDFFLVFLSSFLNFCLIFLSSFIRRVKLKIAFALARSWHGSWTGNKDPLNFKVVEGLGKYNIQANHLLYSSDLNLDKYKNRGKTEFIKSTYIFSMYLYLISVLELVPQGPPHHHIFHANVDEHMREAVHTMAEKLYNVSNYQNLLSFGQLVLWYTGLSYTTFFIPKKSILRFYCTFRPLHVWAISSTKVSDW